MDKEVADVSEAVLSVTDAGAFLLEINNTLSKGEGRKSSWALRNLDFRVGVQAVGDI